MRVNGTEPARPDLRNRRKDGSLKRPSTVRSDTIRRLNRHGKKVTVADTLNQLRNLLAARDEARVRVDTAAARAAEEGSVQKRLQADLRRETDRLSAMEDKVHEVRDSISREIELARTSRTEANESLAQLHALHDSGGLPEEAFALRQEELSARIEHMEGQIATGLRALQAESAHDLNWLDAVGEEHRLGAETEVAPALKPGSLSISEFPGASVPERIAMLWRESKKPQSRRAIIVSTATVSIITVLVLAVVLISGNLNPRGPADYLGKGEVLVPVLVDKAENVRSLEFTLQYDPTILTGISVVQSDVGRLAVMQYDIDKSGEVKVLLRDITGIDGSGSIVIMRFKVNEVEPNPSPVKFAALDAVDSVTIEPRPADGEDGWVNTLNLDVRAPVVRFP